jgi:hypothetical protein
MSETLSMLPNPPTPTPTPEPLHVTRLHAPISRRRALGDGPDPTFVPPGAK